MSTLKFGESYIPITVFGVGLVTVLLTWVAGNQDRKKIVAHPLAPQGTIVMPGSEADFVRTKGTFLLKRVAARVSVPPSNIASRHNWNSVPAELDSGA